MIVQQAELLARLVVGTVLGAIVSYERDVPGRPTGLRTHLSVTLASTTFMLISTHFVYFQHYAKEDLGRRGYVACRRCGGYGGRIPWGRRDVSHWYQRAGSGDGGGTLVENLSVPLAERRTPRDFDRTPRWWCSCDRDVVQGLVSGTRPCASRGTDARVAAQDD